MKNAIYLIALSFTLILAACSDSGQDITSPFSTQLKKDIETAPVNTQSLPYNIYQTFPELKSARVSWYNLKGGLIINVSDLSERISNKHLFASIELVNTLSAALVTKSAALVFLGNLKDGNYYLPGFNEKEIRTITIFYYDATSSTAEKVLPYTNSQLFDGHKINGWSDGGTYVKVSSNPFSSKSIHLYAQLIASEGNQLVFLGNPKSSNFEFPKSEKLNLKDIRLFTYQK